MHNVSSGYNEQLGAKSLYENAHLSVINCESYEVKLNVNSVMLVFDGVVRSIQQITFDIYNKLTYKTH
ncbi:MAG TPA: hypothetical protein PK559_06875 [Ignavibacteriaceae bacterium]|nr:hypothetical protein [Ignavibacteriaceae bacterium]